MGYSGATRRGRIVPSPPSAATTHALSYPRLSLASADAADYEIISRRENILIATHAVSMFSVRVSIGSGRTAAATTL